eukprot:GHVN01053614.1.p1 GENE.GHVN01053614.1~~GHVN01053614.1.p1  ORF type:complete len:164 (-),score=66.74 GHVN01053614.1:1-441(-)
MTHTLDSSRSAPPSPHSPLPSASPQSTHAPTSLHSKLGPSHSPHSDSHTAATHHDCDSPFTRVSQWNEVCQSVSHPTPHTKYAPLIHILSSLLQDSPTRRIAQRSDSLEASDSPHSPHLPDSPRSPDSLASSNSTSLHAPLQFTGC